MAGRWNVVVALTALVLLQPGHGRAAWVVNERGECVEEWRSADLLRGPTAIVNAPLVPVRTAIGGFQTARADTIDETSRKILLPPMLTLAGGAMGLAECGIWLAAGLGDTLTGGALALSPVEATELSA